jgi:hypothetical protein
VNEKDMPQEDQWHSCPQGLIDRMVRSQRALRRRQQLERIAVPVAVLLVLFIGYVATTRNAIAPKLTCTQVMTHLAKYQAGELPAITRTAIDRHLKGCPHCRDEFDKKRLREASRTLWHVMVVSLVFVSPSAVWPATLWPPSFFRWYCGAIISAGLTRIIQA